jgi:hypothetical protein
MQIILFEAVTQKMAQETFSAEFAPDFFFLSKPVSHAGWIKARVNHCRRNYQPKPLSCSAIGAVRRLDRRQDSRRDYDGQAAFCAGKEGQYRRYCGTQGESQKQGNMNGKRNRSI